MADASLAAQRSILLERYTFEQDRPKPFLPALKEDAPWLQMVASSLWVSTLWGSGVA